MKQITNSILMIEPVSFEYNKETAKNNYFQNETDSPQSKALQEFRAMVEKLRNVGVQVLVVKDTEEPYTPDSIFPNNWVSFHANGAVVLYPMFAKNRRAERREDILDFIEDNGFEIEMIEDYSLNENEGIYLEGTGSIIFDRENKLAYASLSERTDEDLLIDVCEDLEYTPIIFESFQTFEGNRMPIYHTNVMMCIATKYAVICLDAIDDAEEKELVKETIQQSGKEIIAITQEQMHQFAGNMLQVADSSGNPILVMSSTALQSLDKEQIRKLQEYNPIVNVEIPTIETNGGGSARCMMAEIFLPKAN